MDQRWNLDRKPSAVEPGIGIGGALLLCAAGLIGLWFSAFERHSRTASGVTGAVTIFGVYLLHHFLFTEGRAPRRGEIRVTALVFIGLGLLLLVGSFFAPGLGARCLMLSLAVSGIAGGLLNFAKAK